MSEAVSAVMGARFHGLARIEETGLQGMITLRGDLASKPMAKAVKSAVGVAIPAQRSVTMDGDSSAAWMSPDELLLLCPHDTAEATTAALGEALAGQHHMAVNVSDARAVFHVTGPAAREVLGKLCPVDFSRDVFAVGEIRRTRMAQVAAAVWQEDEDTFRVVCFRSVGDYVFNLLKVAADPESGVGVY
ncbi:MAG: sarcosine oxidase subunit gamma [Paracoccaceae bacterium]